MLFGLSKSFWMAVIRRFLLGSLCGVVGPVKAYATELFREEHQAIGLSIQQLCVSGFRDDLVIGAGANAGALLVDGLLLESPNKDFDFLRSTSFNLLQGCRNFKAWTRA
ncbi:unnamed protein product [Lupinus luteus]|uniref:Uncharacterized protein n=1 Tax=Lupinus luteus TaxID=3873 RepID=A0AAV1XIL8_LUPLU